MRSIRGLSWLILILVMLATATAAHAQAASGQICVLAFEDLDGNGIKGDDEPLLSGVGFTLADETGVKGSYSTDGNSEPYCFGNLSPGSYTVQARKPADMETTTEGQWAISLASGAQFDVTYGARAASPAAQAAAPASSGGMSTLGRIALAGLGLLVLVGSGFMFFTTLQRARAAR
ncbi:MAG: hypothetical protein HXY24_17775 [Rubrivivax sp.]|nr:hypothetical protein [Rubrivivax sp.]